MQALKREPLRVLHSVGSLNRGGIETWLVNLLRQRSDEVHFDFLVSVPGGAYDEEVKSYGSRIFVIPRRTRIRKRLDMVGLGHADRTIERVLTTGNYHVFHAHGTEFLGDAVEAAARCRVPVRVAHCHSTGINRWRGNPELWVRGLRFRTLDRHRILRYASDILAVSLEAGRFLLPRQWDTDERCKIRYCGVPLDQFADAQRKCTRAEFRRAHGIPDDAIVIGHVGSMGSGTKNQAFLLRVFAELAKRNERYFLFMAGDGSRRALLKHEVEKLNLQRRVFLPGLFSDVPLLMVHGFDAHVLPSLYEGLPIVGLEAAASGLYTVCSDTITKDYIERLPTRVKAVSLKASVEVWADEIEAAVSRRQSPEEGIALLRRSPFSIESSLEALLSIYRERVQPPE